MFEAAGASPAGCQTARVGSEICRAKFQVKEK